MRGVVAVGLGQVVDGAECGKGGRMWAISWTEGSVLRSCALKGEGQINIGSTIKHKIQQRGHPLRSADRAVLARVAPDMHMVLRRFDLHAGRAGRGWVGGGSVFRPGTWRGQLD